MQPVEPDAGTDQIRRRAFEIWQEEGQPEGRDQDHWNQAVRERLGTPGEQSTEAPAPDAASEGGAASGGEAAAETIDLLGEDSAAAVVEADYAKRMLAGHLGEADAEETRTGSRPASSGS